MSNAITDTAHVSLDAVVHAVLGMCVVDCCRWVSASKSILVEAQGTPVGRGHPNQSRSSIPVTFPKHRS